jgi:hypothetical protein
MARINLNEFGGQAGGLAYRVNQVRTDPAVVAAAREALHDVKVASRSCSVLGREATASWQRSRPTASTSSAYRTGRPVPSAPQAHEAPEVQDRSSNPAPS